MPPPEEEKLDQMAPSSSLAADPSQSERYDGEFREGDRHGVGQFTFENGDKYAGESSESALVGRAQCAIHVPLLPAEPPACAAVLVGSRADSPAPRSLRQAIGSTISFMGRAL